MLSFVEAKYIFNITVVAALSLFPASYRTHKILVGSRCVWKKLQANSACYQFHTELKIDFLSYS